MIYLAQALKSQSILEKLFTWQYFEPVLFGSIGVLLVLLFIVLFLGKKDQKKKLEETQKLELNSLTEDNSVDAFAKEDTNASLEVPKEEKEEEPIVINDAMPMNMDTTEEAPAIEEPIMEPTDSPNLPDFEIFKAGNENSAKEESNTEEIPVPEVSEISVVADEEKEPESEPEVVNINAIEEAKEEDIPVVSTPDIPAFEVPADDVIKTIVTPEEEVEEKKEEEPLTDAKINEFKENFADLASSISKELDEINRMQEEANKSKDLPTVEEKELPSEVPVTPVKEASKFTPTEVFSSVYTPNSIKSEKEEVKEKPVLSDEAKDEIPFELPKIAESGNPFADEMPAVKETIELPKTNEQDNGKVNAPDFSAFADEIFEIK